MRYRGTSGRAVKLTLGSADVSGQENEQDPAIGGHLTVAAARRLAAEVQRQRALGRDPSGDYFATRQRRRAVALERSRNTFAAQIEAFILEFAKPKNRRWRETARLFGLRTVEDEGRSRLETIRGGLAERWANKPVVEITRNDVFNLVKECQRSGVPGLPRRNKSSGATMGRAVHVALHTFFNWLIRNHVADMNPCVGVARPPASAPRDRILSDNEIRWFWQACDEIGQPFGSMLKFLLVSGQRLREVAGMTRGELSADIMTWTIPAVRVKNKRMHIVPLPPLARDIIANLRPIAGKPGYLFTTNGRTPVSGFSKIKRRIDEKMIGLARKETSKTGGEPNDVTIPEWRLHDLRRTAVSGMARAGADLHVIERAINHVSGSFAGVVGTYQRHRYFEEVRASLEVWANLLRQITTGTSAAKVITMRAGVAE